MAQVETVSLLRDGIAAARSGDKRRARELLRRVTQADPTNELAWLWLATAADDPHESVLALRRVLEISPANPHAAAALPDALVRAGIASAKASDRTTAKSYFAEATDMAPRNETAWLWRAGMADSPQEGIEMLGYVLNINPTNDRARQGIDHYRGLLSQQRKAWECPLCGERAGGPVSDGSCPQCGAMLNLDDPAVFDSHRPIDRDRLEAAARRLYDETQTAPSAETIFHLGLVYLNLGYAAEGLQTVQAAVSRGRPADPNWKGQVERLARHHQRLARRTAVNEDLYPSRPTVVVVDDSPTIRKLVSVTLTGAGYAVTEAADGYEVAEKVRQVGVPRLFILDINMPGLDGLQLCKMLKQNAETAGVPVVFLTGKDGFFNKLRGQWAGATEYLTKPFDPQKLLATVEKLVSANAGR